MKPMPWRGSRPSSGTIVLALLPAGGVDTDPPQLFSYLLYPVPCDRWVAPLAGAVTAVLVGLGLWAEENNRRRQ